MTMGAGRVARDDRLAAGPVALSYRGARCPICDTEPTRLEEALGRIKELGASLLAVSPQAPDASQTLVQRLGLGCHVLSDLDQSVSRAYRLQFELPPQLRAANRQMGMALDEHNATDRGTCRCPRRSYSTATASFAPGTSTPTVGSG